MELEARVLRLERENHLFRVCGLLLLVVAGVVILSGQAGPRSKREISGRSFVVVDEKGKERVSLSPEGLIIGDLDAGEAYVILDSKGLQFSDPGGTPWAALRKHSLNIWQGRDRSLTLSPAELTLSAENSRGVSLGVGAIDRWPYLTLSDKHGARLNLTSSSLEISDANEQERVQLFHLPTTGTQLILSGPDGKVLWGAP
jgi:hypothetical protein